MDCQERIQSISSYLLEALLSGCEDFRKSIEGIVECRTPTRGVLPTYIMYQLGDMLGRTLRDPSNSIKTILRCWLRGDREVRFILSVALGRVAMAFPVEVEVQVAEVLHLDDGSLSKWVVPVIMIWDKGSIFRIFHRNEAAKWALIDSLVWYSKYSPEDVDYALYVLTRISGEPDPRSERAFRSINKLKSSREVTGPELTRAT